MFKIRSLTHKAVGIIGISLFLFGAVSIPIIVGIESNNIKEDLFLDIKQLAELETSNIEKEFDLALEKAKGQAIYLKNLIEIQKASRNQADEVLKTIVETDPNRHSVWAVFKENSFDGKDAEFMHTERYGKTGSYSCWWHQIYTSNPINETLKNFEIEPWYLETSQSNLPVLLEPYKHLMENGDSILFITAGVPIILNNEIIGYTGTEINSEYIGRVISDVSYFNKNDISLISPKGICAYNSNNTLIGTPISFETFSEKDKIAFNNGQTIEKISKTKHLNNEVYDFFLPIKFKSVDKNWYVRVSVPVEIVSNQVIAFRNKELIQYGLAALLIVLIIYFVIYISIRPLKKITRSLTEQASKGTIGTAVAVKENNNDEIGALSKSYNQLLKSLIEKEENEASMLLLSNAIENSVNEVFIFNAENYKFSFINSGAIKNIGFEHNELMEMTPIDIKPELTSKSFSELISPLKNDEVNKLQFQTLHQRKDKTTYPVEINLSKVKTESGIYFLAVINDITERKLQEEKLIKAKQDIEKNEENLKVTLNSIGDAIIATDQNRLITRMNPVAEKLTGWNLTEVKGKTIDDVFNIVHADSRNIEPNPVNLALKTGEVQELANHTVLINSDGSERHIADAAAPIRDNQGEIIGVILNFRDVTEQYKVRKELEHMGFMADNALDLTKSGYWSIDLTDQEYYTSSEKTAEIFGDPPSLGYRYKLVEHWGECIKAVNVEIAENTFKIYNDAVEGKIPRYDAIYPYKRPIDGKTAWIHAIGHVVSDADGKATYMYGVVQDVTEQQQQQQEINKRQQQFQEVFNNAPSMMLIVDKDVKVKKINKAAEKNTNYKSGVITDLLAGNLFNCVHTQDDKVCGSQDACSKCDVRNLVSHVLKTGETIIKREGKLTLMKDGVPLTITLLISVTQLTKSNFVLLTLEDITQRVNQEKELRKNEARLSQVVETGKMGTYEINFRTKYVEANDLMYEILGIPQDSENVLNEFFSNIHPDDFELVSQIFQKEKNATNKNSTQLEYRYIHPEKGEIWVQHIGRVFERKYEGTGGKQIGYLQDITKRKLQEQELTDAKEKAEESDRLKSAFLSNMSHEIRTPMNGILGFIDLLSQPNLSDEEKDNFSEIINKSSSRLLNTINDIIDISKIESEQVSVTNKKVNVNDVLDELNAFFILEANKKGLSISSLTSLSFEESVIYTDSNKLHGILTNLIKNAVKFTTKGSISFGYKLKEDFLEFFVKDTGIGIPHNRQQGVFNRFEQADIGDSKVFEGSGLGLTISKAYVEMLGGKMWVVSEENKGAEFIFTIPYNRKDLNKFESTSKTKETDKGKIDKLSLLVAEDDEISIKYFQSILQDTFKNVIYVQNGIDAVETCKKNRGIDLVLMDIRMPKMDGFDAIREIRKFDKELIIITQTAFAFSEDKEKAIKAGSNDFISKPINKKALLEMISKYFNKNRS